MEGLAPKAFPQIKEWVHWWRLRGDLSLGKPCRVLLSYMMKQTYSAKCLVEMEMPILLVEIQVASITLKKHLTVPA